MGQVVKRYGLNTDIEDRKRVERVSRLRELDFQTFEEQRSAGTAQRSGERDLRSIIDTIPRRHGLRTPTATATS
jgi:hypothetical protein